MSPDQVVKVLAEPIKINNLTIANRMVMGPMAAAAPEADGSPSKQTIAFFEARARGGIGMIIVGGAIATRRGYEEAPFRPLLRFDIDDHIPKLKEVAEAVHAYNVPIIAQLAPGFGRMGVPAPGRPIISASAKNVVIPKDRLPRGILAPADTITPIPQEATIAEIKTYEQQTVEAIERAARANWDGVEVSAHMSYFTSSFVSPRTNWRYDEYGGPTANRARMLFNIIDRARKVVRANFILGLRITANDYLPDGQGPEEFAAVAKEVEAAGLDYVALSTGSYETMDMSAPSVDGGLVDSGDARIFKQKLKVPVLIQGLHDPVRAAQAIADGHGDLVMLARPMLADANYAQKVKAGRLDAIIKCTRDNYCMRRMILKMPVRCEVNPDMGRESRKPGSFPPFERIIKTPIEQIILKLTANKSIIDALGKLAKKNKIV